MTLSKYPGISRPVRVGLLIATGVVIAMLLRFRGVEPPSGRRGAENRVKEESGVEPPGRNFESMLPADVLRRVTSAAVVFESVYRPADLESAAHARRESLRVRGVGFVIGEDGLVLAGANAVAAYQYVSREAHAKEFSEGRSHELFVLDSVDAAVQGKHFEAQVLGVSEAGVALLRVQPARRLAPLSLAPEAPAYVGATVWTIHLGGAPDAVDISAPTTIVEHRLAEDGSPLELVARECPPGDGGFLVDTAGTVLGVSGPADADRQVRILPAGTVRRTFARTLSWIALRRARGFHTVLVDSAAAGGTSGIESALASAVPGDEILLLPGRHEVAGPLRVPPGISLRGTSAGIATISGSKLEFRIGSGHFEERPFPQTLPEERGEAAVPGSGADPFTEVAGITMAPSAANDLPTAIVSMASGCGTESFLHDIVVTAPGDRVAISLCGSASPCLEHVRIGLGTASLGDLSVSARADGLCRIRRSDFPQGVSAWPSSSAIFSGCTMSRTSDDLRPSVLVGSWSDVVLEGCRVASMKRTTSIPVLCQGGSLRMKHCLLLQSLARGDLLVAQPLSRVRMESCEIRGHNSSVVLRGPGTEAVLRDTTIVNCHLRVLDGAGAAVEGGSFLCTVAPDQVDREFDLFATDRASHVFALRAEGEGSRIDYRACAFFTLLGNTAASATDGAGLTSGGGNRCTGGAEVRKK